VRYQEDLPAGTVIELGSVTVDESQLIDFSTQFDPQPFHIDPTAAKVSQFGGVIASGWHIGSLYMALLVRGLLNDTAAMGGTGLENMRIRQPVRGGDTLRARVTIAESRPAKNRPGQGTVVFDGEIRNQNDELVSTIRIYGRVTRRDAMPDGP
jgi:acyl dehydratase